MKKVILTKTHFVKHPELNVQGVKPGDEVNAGSLLVNQNPEYHDWQAKQSTTEGEVTTLDDTGGNPPPPIPFPPHKDPNG